MLSNTILSVKLPACMQAALRQHLLLIGCGKVVIPQNLSLLYECRSHDLPQQAAILTAAPAAEAIVYDAPPMGPPQPDPVEAASHDMMMAHYQTGNTDYAAGKGMSEMAGGGSGAAAQSDPSSPSVQRSALPNEAAGSSIGPPKGW